MDPVVFKHPERLRLDLCVVDAVPVVQHLRQDLW
jgi:hypothetical protein